MTLELKSPAKGYIQALDAGKVGSACVRLGAGRATLNDKVDPAVGIRFMKKVGDTVSCGEAVGVVFANDADRGRAALSQLLEALTVSESPPPPRPLIGDLVRSAEGDESAFP